jgi:hypothetical protein
MLTVKDCQMMKFELSTSGNIKLTRRQKEKKADRKVTYSNLMFIVHIMSSTILYYAVFN